MAFGSMKGFPPKKLPPKKPSFGGSPKSFSKPPDKGANKEYGGLPPKKVSNATLDFDRSQGNVERGFKQNTPKKATAATGFKAMSAPGNSDFGYIGSSSPDPMMPVNKKKPRKVP